MKVVAFVDDGRQGHEVEIVEVSDLQPNARQVVEQNMGVALKMGVFELQGDAKIFYPAARIIYLKQTEYVGSPDCISRNDWNRRTLRTLHSTDRTG